PWSWPSSRLLRAVVGLVRGDGVADHGVELPNEKLLVAEVELPLPTRRERRVRGLDRVDVLHRELDRGGDREVLGQSLVRVRRRDEVHVDLVDVRVDRFRRVRVRDEVVAGPDLDRQVWQKT